MKNQQLIVSVIITVGTLVLAACGGDKTPETETFQLPKLPIMYRLGKDYLQPDSVETVFRADSQAQRVRLEIRLLDKDAAKLWRVDTMKFQHKNYYANWDTQKSGYYWLIQGLTSSTRTKRNKDGLELEIHDRLDENFVFNPVRQPGKGDQYPTINYKVMDEYWSSLRADAVGIANPSDNELFVMAHPIRTRLRGKDEYRKISDKDSVAIPNYYDKVDSSKLVCLRISILALNNK